MTKQDAQLAECRAYYPWVSIRNEPVPEQGEVRADRECFGDKCNLWERIKGECGIMILDPTAATLCASCGKELRPDYLIQPSVCPECEDKMRDAEDKWAIKEEQR